MDPWDFVLSFIYKLYRVGTRTDPCGTPAFTSRGVDILPSTIILNVLLERIEQMGLIILALTMQFG
jgi:hypothetical protein